MASPVAASRETPVPGCSATSCPKTSATRWPIAREAGVGIATLYRHFPTRESLVEAVYRDRVQRLTQGAHELLDHVPPAEALRRWMDLFGGWLATKHGMIDALRAMIDAGDITLADTREELVAAIDEILGAGVGRGLRGDVAAQGVATSILGISSVSGPTGEQTPCLLDLLMDGVRSRSEWPPPSAQRPAGVPVGEPLDGAQPHRSHQPRQDSGGRAPGRPS